MRTKKNIMTSILLLSIAFPIQGKLLSCADLSFIVSINSPEKHLHPIPRTPVEVPRASLDGNILYINSCEGCEVILSQNDETVYTTNIISGKAEFPTNIHGIYILKIICGIYCYWTEIEL